jgi:outer membrane protein
MKKLSAVLVFIMIAGMAFGQKFAYINTQEILGNLPEVKQANANIETFRNQLISLGQKKLESLQKKYKELELQQQRGELSPVQLDAEAKKLKTDEEALQKFDQQSQQRIMEKSEELLKPIRDKVQKAIDEVAKEKGYEFIFDASMGFILYADENTDISNVIKTKLGIK